MAANGIVVFTQASSGGLIDHDVSLRNVSEATSVSAREQRGEEFRQSGGSLGATLPPVQGSMNAAEVTGQCSSDPVPHG